MLHIWSSSWVQEEFGPHIIRKLDDSLCGRLTVWSLQLRLSCLGHLHVVEFGYFVACTDELLKGCLMMAVLVIGDAKLGWLRKGFGDSVGDQVGMSFCYSWWWTSNLSVHVLHQHFVLRVWTNNWVASKFWLCFGGWSRYVQERSRLGEEVDLA